MLLSAPNYNPFLNPFTRNCTSYRTLHLLFVQHHSDKMKFQLLLFVSCLLAVSASAVVTQKAVIVSYPSDTPDSIVVQAMDAVREAVSTRFRWNSNHFLHVDVLILTVPPGWCYHA